MKKYRELSTLFLMLLLLDSCNTINKQSDNKDNETTLIYYPVLEEKDLLNDYKPVHEDGEINVAIEIPAGTLEKWEVDKNDGKIKLQFIDENPRINAPKTAGKTFDCVLKLYGA